MIYFELTLSFLFYILYFKKLYFLKGLIDIDKQFIPSLHLILNLLNNHLVDC